MRDVAIRHKNIIATIVLALALTLAHIELLSTNTAAQSSAPPTVREVEFTYHTELTGIDSKAHHVEAWIPLPREDRFQRVSALSIDSPAHVEVIDQPTGGNRVAHLSATAPLAPSIPITIRFKVRRVEEAADPTRAQRNLPEPRDGKFAATWVPTA